MNEIDEKDKLKIYSDLIDFNEAPLNEDQKDESLSVVQTNSKKEEVEVVVLSEIRNRRIKSKNSNTTDNSSKINFLTLLKKKFDLLKKIDSEI